MGAAVSVKPRIRLLAEIPTLKPDETRMERATRILRECECSGTWASGQGPRYWTADRIGRLSAQNEEHRMRRRTMKGLQ